MQFTFLGKNENLLHVPVWNLKWKIYHVEWLHVFPSVTVYNARLHWTNLAELFENLGKYGSSDVNLIAKAKFNNENNLLFVFFGITQLCM